MEMLGHELVADNMRDLLSARAALGEQPLLICQGRTLTYADADLQANRVANALAELGVEKGDTVATFMYNSVEHVLVWFGCAKLGAIYAPLNVSLGKDDLTYSLEDTGASVVVVDEELRQTLAEATASLADRPLQIVFGGDAGGSLPFERLLEGDSRQPDVEIRAGDPLAIVYTGGSTSMPKGVLATHTYYIAAALRYQEIAEPVAGDVHYANSHLFHSGGQQFGVTGPLYSGITGVMHKWFSASRYWDTVREHDVSIIDPLGTMIAVLMRAPEGARDREHRVRVGVGVATGQVRRDVRDGFEERFGIPLLEVYSMTEMGVMICSERSDDRRPGSSGRPHGWADIRIVDADDEPVPAGEQGQIVLRPTVFNSCMVEYVNKPRETIAAWRNLWYHSGDLGYLDDDGYLYFAERQAHWIRRRGENVSAFEVEKVISSIEGVVDCAVVGVPAELGEEDIKAYVQVGDGAEAPSPEAVVARCAEQIAFFKVPRYVELVDALPRTLTKSEIARSELRARGVGDAWDAEAAAPSGV
jgi:crotonobetaine/carnitine-CoA ligase